MLTDIYKNITGIFEKNKKIIFISAFVVIIFLSIFPRAVEIFNQNPICRIRRDLLIG